MNALTAPPRELPMISPEVVTFLPDIARQLAASYRSAGRSPKTIQSYVETLTQFGAFALEQFGTDDPGDVTVEMIEAYTGHIRDTRSATTAKIRFVTLRACWRWMLRRGFVDRDLFLQIAAPTVDQRQIGLLEDADVRSIIATTDGSGFLNRRDRAVLLILADTACRRQDVAQLRLEDTDLALGRVIFRQTKANRDRSAALSSTTILSIRRYLKDRGRIADAATTNLFVSRTGGAISGDGIYQMLSSRYRRAGVAPDRAVHAFRSWAAVRMLDLGASEVDVMSIAGWRQVSTLVRYQRGRQHDRALAKHSSFSPVTGL